MRPPENPGTRSTQKTKKHELRRKTDVHIRERREARGGLLEQRALVHAVRLPVLQHRPDFCDAAEHARRRARHGARGVVRGQDVQLLQVALRRLWGEEREERVDAVLWRMRGSVSRRTSHIRPRRSQARRGKARGKQCAREGSAAGGGGREAAESPRRTRRCQGRARSLGSPM